MIMSGWILPSGISIKCKSCSTLYGHVEVVKKYLNELKMKNIKEYEKLHLKSDTPLDDFALKELEWIKVINYPYKYVFYHGNSNMVFALPYEKYGSTIIEIN